MRGPPCVTPSSSPSAAVCRGMSFGHRPTTTLPSPPRQGACEIRALERAPGPAAPAVGRQTLLVCMNRGCATAGSHNILTEAATAAALEGRRRSRIAVVRSDRCGGPWHATRGAAGNQVAWRVPTHTLQLRPDGEWLAHAFTLGSASGVAPPHPSTTISVRP